MSVTAKRTLSNVFQEVCILSIQNCKDWKNETDIRH